MNLYQSIELPFPIERFQGRNVVKLDDSFYVVDRQYCYFQGKCIFPLTNPPHKFTFYAWAVVSGKEYRKLLSQNDVAVRECTGSLLTDLPFFEMGEGMRVLCRFDTSDPDFKSPFIVIYDSESPLFEFQNNGIPDKTYYSWMKILQIR